MEAHPETGICGTWAQAFGEAQFQLLHPVDPERIRAKLLFDSAFVHPSVLMRRRLLNAYDLRYPPLAHFEDYVLWQQAARVFPLANLPERLLRYRITSGSAFHGANEAERQSVYRGIDERSLRELGLAPTAAQMETHSFLRCPFGDRTEDAEAWLLTLRDANAQAAYYDPAAFRDTLRDRWFLVCYLASGSGLARWRRYFRSPLSDPTGQPAAVRVKLPAKFLLQGLRGRLGV